ncbi:MAG: hypothetical protein C0404_02910 [Verrucomicrobia bacterium]|nr:hypothetical protein [Verrucomicrobiota bacterium]
MSEEHKSSGKSRIAIWLLAAGFSILLIALMLTIGGTPPEFPRAYAWQKSWWFARGIFAIVTVLPFYVLARLAVSSARSRAVRVIYMAAMPAVGAFGIVFKSYEYSLAMIICQMLIICGLYVLIRVGAGAGRLRYALTVAASLGVSFIVNYAIAPYVHMAKPKDYFGPEMPADIRQQLEFFYWVWDDDARMKAAHAAMRKQNPEWDMISRTFFAYSLANVALKYPAEKERALKYLDKVIDNTVRVPWQDFLLDYGTNMALFVKQPPSSVMVDGEVSLMIGLRRLVRDEPDYPHKELHRKLVNQCLDSMKAGPMLCGECYPDECWLWCNPLALTSAKVLDVLEGSDNTEFYERWEKMALAKLTDKKTGMLQSAVTLTGYPIHTSEGSTIWIGASCLLPVLPDLAHEQYNLMKEKLSGRLLFLAYGREWPKGERGDWDIDSGFTPFGMGPASTGFALVASKEMGDEDFFVRLLTLLNLVGVPQVENGRMRYLSSNLVGDATFLYGKTAGPAWQEIIRRDKERRAKK